MNTIKITLGGRDYEIRPLPIKAAREWRGKFQEQFGQIADALGGMFDVQLTRASDLGQILLALKSYLLGSIDAIVEMLFNYSPELMADRERIEAEATDDEAMAAFVEVLKLAYPFGQIKKLLGSVNG